MALSGMGVPGAWTKRLGKILQHTRGAATNQLICAARVREIRYRSQRSVVDSNLSFRAALRHDVTSGRRCDVAQIHVALRVQHDTCAHLVAMTTKTTSGCSYVARSRIADSRVSSSPPVLDRVVTQSDVTQRDVTQRHKY